MKKISFWAVIIVALIALFTFPNPKIVIIFASILLLILAYIFYKRRITEELIIAIFFALFIVTYNPHIYTTNDILIGKISVFALVSWIIGLVILREIYEHYPYKFKWIAMSAFYIVALLLLEYVGFHILGIKIIGNEPSFLGLGILHGPISLHIIYVLAGPLYLLATDYLRVK